MIELITTANQALYQGYGSRLVAGFEEFAAPDIRLIVVFDGPIPPGINAQCKRTLFVPFESAGLRQFQRFFGHLYEANGLRIKRFAGQDGQLQLLVRQNFRFNAVRFSFKIFAIEIAKTLLGPASSFAWIDADVKCLKAFSAKDLEPFMPRADELMSFLGRDSFPPESPYSECGFLGFNRAHPQVDAFLERMRALYVTGEIFSLQEWHDSWLWDEVRREFERGGAKFRNISGAAAATEHPFINCGLGEFFDHLKGPEAKERGESLDSDYVLRLKSSASPPPRKGHGAAG